MTRAHTHRIPARHGWASRLAAGDTVAIAAPEGPQVADLWAFAEPDLNEVLSTEHTRSCLDQLAPRVGEAFYSSRRRAMLTVVEDTSPGVHDLLLSACDHERCRLLGFDGPHRTCVDNLHEALATLGLAPPHVPSPVNVFESVTIAPDGTLSIEPPTVAPGQWLTLRAEMDLVVAISACPMDIVPTNGLDLTPKPIDVAIAPAA